MLANKNKQTFTFKTIYITRSLIFFYACTLELMMAALKNYLSLNPSLAGQLMSSVPSPTLSLHMKLYQLLYFSSVRCSSPVALLSDVSGQEWSHVPKCKYQNYKLETLFSNYGVPNVTGMKFHDCVKAGIVDPRANLWRQK